MTDTFFYLMTLSSVNDMILKLRVRQQSMKARLYTHFQWVLYTSCVLCISWTVYVYIYIYNTDQPDSHWQQRWAVDAVYEGIYLALFVAMAFLWAPSKNSQRYAYSIELASRPRADNGTLL